MLIASDLVLTAGHCFGERHECQDLAFVLDFTAEHAKGGRLDSETVFGCNTLMLRRATALRVHDGLDFANVKLDRATQRDSPILSIAPLHEGDGLWRIGLPKGIPMKANDSVRAHEHLTHVAPGDLGHDTTSVWQLRSARCRSRSTHERAALGWCWAMKSPIAKRSSMERSVQRTIYFVFLGRTPKRASRRRPSPS